MTLVTMMQCASFLISGIISSSKLYWTSESVDDQVLAQMVAFIAHEQKVTVVELVVAVYFNNKIVVFLKVILLMKISVVF